jgi:hypothetical protein
MKPYWIATALIISFSSPALAEQIYVVFDPASHKCEAMHDIPEGKKSMGTYGSMEEATKAMHGMKECGGNM